MLEDRHFGMDAEIQRPGMAKWNLSQCLTQPTSDLPWPGCIRDILVPNPAGGGTVQIGYPADLSGIHASMTALLNGSDAEHGNDKRILGLTPSSQRRNEERFIVNNSS